MCIEHVLALQYFYWSFHGDTFFVDPFCYLFLMFVFVMLSCLYPTALCSPAGKRVDLLAFSCVVFSFVFVTFPYAVPDSGVVLDCIDS